MNITFSTCFYVLNSKFEPHIYVQWMNNFISIVQNFYLVIYTDEKSFSLIPSSAKENKNICIVIKNLNEFHCYKWKEQWIMNHTKNDLLREKICWEVNMLWSEKLWFVLNTKNSQYFKEETPFYGWCDIGYFRNNHNNTHTNLLQNKWPNLKKINKDKIYYACICNDKYTINTLCEYIQNKNSHGLPNIPIPPNQNSIAGGFFILFKDLIQEWCNTYENKLQKYFDNNYLIKDDQIILADCIFTEPEKFQLVFENDYNFDNWFLFQRYLL
jgi:hypothetical protein